MLLVFEVCPIKEALTSNSDRLDNVRQMPEQRIVERELHSRFIQVQRHKQLLNTISNKGSPSSQNIRFLY